MELLMEADRGRSTTVVDALSISKTHCYASLNQRNELQLRQGPPRRTAYVRAGWRSYGCELTKETTCF